MQKRYLFTPGPTPVPPEVLAASAEPIVHHRGSDFRGVYESTLARLKDVFRTSPTSCSSPPRGRERWSLRPRTSARRATVSRSSVHGAFGERWLAICKQHGLDVHAIQYEWGERPIPEEVGCRLASRGAGIVFCQQSDTSTGVVADVRAIKEAVGDAALVVDAISSLGAVPLETDEWGSTSSSPARRRR